MLELHLLGKTYYLQTSHEEDRQELSQSISVIESLMSDLQEHDDMPLDRRLVMLCLRLARSYHHAQQAREKDEQNRLTLLNLCDRMDSSRERSLAYL